MPEETANSRAVAPVEILAPDFVKENAFVLHEGVITIRTRPTLTPVLNRPDETARRIRGLVKLRDAVRETLRTQLQDSGEEAVLDARRALNFQYDHFISRFGAGNENANRRAFRGDPAEKRLFLAETQASGLLARIFHPFLNRRHCGLEAAKFTSDRGFVGFLRGFRRIWADCPRPPSAFERRGTRG